MSPMRKLAVLLLASCVAPAFAGGFDFNKSYQDVNTAVLKKDMKTVEKLLTTGSVPEFKYIPLKGAPTTVQVMVAQMKGQLAVMGPVTRCTTKISKQVMKGNTAMLTVVSGFTTSIKDPQGKVHSITSDGVTTDTWVNIGGTWKMKEMKVVSEKNAMDGKVVPTP
jgi:Domain of unknown function (DUF4440)